MGRWGDGEMGRWGDGEMGRWGDGEMGGWGKLKNIYPHHNGKISGTGKMPIPHGSAKLL
ncbi:MAG: hypothetical protein F6K23_03660 [Okeania sp. SIO2C9]|uniref:hypothetical protein n=1 Tax=Okeania sp. SIO2C9 TaxID=2607791 RepID=UPI0013BFF9F0|nr:hypothetical protein [Okeania sp. SIO2C9]NEQ72251.1 hypothetical protein [Okeania sp. SIO2C9]